MSRIQYDSPKALAEYLKDHGLGMTKKFGQNFLISPHARSRIIDHLSLPATDTGQQNTVWEIGPGLGAMTHMLLDDSRVSSLMVFEIDYGFCAQLRDLFGDIPTFRLIEGDFLKTWKETQKQFGEPASVIGNLPYNSGSVMIGSFIENQVLPEQMVFTLQKEVAQRITAQPGTKSYSSFSLLCSMDYDTEIVFDLGPGNFYPKPDVISSVVVFTRKKESSVPQDLREIFRKIVTSLFHARRKTVKNNLQNSGLGSQLGKAAVAEALQAAGIDERQRGENLSLEQMLVLAGCCKQRLVQNSD